MDLHDIVSKLGALSDPKLLVGFDTADDAAVYALRDDLAIVQTADFITPIVDDPYVFGQIAATNALSDVYAMGGAPLLALNLCCFPETGIEKSDLRKILEGGLSKIQEAGALLVGGHTVRDKELKYGLSVTGTMHPRDLKPNRGAKPGDVIVLTKPIGTGVLTTAAKKDLIGEVELEPAIKAMTTLNRRAAEVMNELGAHAATDITGFGLAVHLLEVARASRVRIQLDWKSVPLFDGVRKWIAQGVKTGMTLSNEQAAFGKIEFAPGISREDQLAIFDPQTSGGLAVFLTSQAAESFVSKLKSEGIEVWTIGRVVEGEAFLDVRGSAS